MQTIRLGHLSSGRLGCHRRRTAASLSPRGAGGSSEHHPPIPPLSCQRRRFAPSSFLARVRERRSRVKRARTARRRAGRPAGPRRPPLRGSRAPGQGQGMGWARLRVRLRLRARARLRAINGVRHRPVGLRGGDLAVDGDGGRGVGPISGLWQPERLGLGLGLGLGVQVRGRLGLGLGLGSGLGLRVTVRVKVKVRLGVG